MADKEYVHLEIQEGTSSTGEAVWKDAGTIHLLDKPSDVAAVSQRTPANSTDETTSSSKQALPKCAKEWLLSKHTIKTKKDRQNLYLFRNAVEGGNNNTNLLVLLHGAGDSHRPFDKLAQTMSLPQTATLSINSRVCGIELPFGLGSSWFQEMDYTSGNPLPLLDAKRQTTLEQAVEYLDELLQRLSTAWAPERIFLFGYGAGATVTVETCRLRSGSRFGGAICVGMEGLGGTRTITNPNNNSGTPILLLSHDSKLMKECQSEYEGARGKELVDTCVQENKGMIAGPTEMEAVMKFLSKRLVLATQFPQASAVPS